ncbi:MAG: chemotaxis-specific protein-glutamate methyltransferase CheB [Methylophilaceae bacterium]|jgi:two-component system chemotaxis response regulator CheB|nr:chemotaxis-specific protein-glutamate methyltransferase CheB [Methylophilaceae bacterium]
MPDNAKPALGKRAPIRLLVVEDSPAVREFLLYLFASDQEIQVIGTAGNGEEALEAVKAKQPDVITMDLHMPKMDGYAATRAIMENTPTPIVIVTGSSTTDEMSTTLSALEAGALAVMKRPTGVGHPDHAATARELIQTVKLMSEIKVVKRWAKHKVPTATPSDMTMPEMVPPAPSSHKHLRLVAIGSSTGGPLVLQQLLTRLPKDFPLPIIIVQHIAQGFTEGFVQWLTEASGFPVRLAVHGQVMMPGHAYVVPNGFQPSIDAYARITLKKDPPENGHCPSVSCLFRSVAQAYGASAVGVLLTGMGKDGAAELGLMRANGALTIAQDKESSVVHGMPGEAIALGAAAYVLGPDKIASALISVVRS